MYLFNISSLPFVFTGTDPALETANIQELQGINYIPLANEASLRMKAVDAATCKQKCVESSDCGEASFLNGFCTLYGSDFERLVSEEDGPYREGWPDSTTYRKTNTRQSASMVSKECYFALLSFIWFSYGYS